MRVTFSLVVHIHCAQDTGLEIEVVSQCEKCCTVEPSLKVSGYLRNTKLDLLDTLWQSRLTFSKITATIIVPISFLSGLL